MVLLPTCSPMPTRRPQDGGKKQSLSNMQPNATRFQMWHPRPPFPFLLPATYPIPPDDIPDSWCGSPNTESLKDAQARAWMLWRERVVPSMRRGKTVLICAHGNVIRAMLKRLDCIPNDSLKEVRSMVGCSTLWLKIFGLRWGTSRAGFGGETVFDFRMFSSSVSVSVGEASSVCMSA